MKKLYLLQLIVIALLLSGNFASAQTETDTTFATQMNYIFAHVDKSNHLQAGYGL